MLFFLSACNTEPNHKKVATANQIEQQLISTTSDKKIQQEIKASEVTTIKQLNTKLLNKNKVKVNMISVEGTIRYFDLEGGFYGIVTDKGQKLLPLNLAKEYQQAGAVVKVKGKLQQDMMTTQQWGTPFKISHITVLKKGEEQLSLQ
jgi:hypothetical protein